MSDDAPKLHIEGDWKAEAQAEKERLAADESPGLRVDSDWKAEAQAEKERLTAQEEKAAVERRERGGDAGGPGAMPEASFRSLMGVLASQALMGLGTMQDPKTGGVIVDLEGARFSIDLLGVLEEKTKGNLEEQDDQELQQLLAELRSRYVQVTELVARQMAEGGGAGVPGGGPPPPMST